MRHIGLAVLMGLLLSCSGKVKNHAELIYASSPRISEPEGTIEILIPEGKTISTRFNPPAGYIRKETDSNSFQFYLRNLPLKNNKEQVYLYNGDLKSRQDVHAAIIDLDVGTRDLQQCADAVMRLRAEYLYKLKYFDQIHFKYTNGFNADYAHWADGYRIKVIGDNVSWQKIAPPSYSYPDFRKYLENVFMYAGTLSLSKELLSTNINEAAIGDVFIKGGSPGHAVIIVDSCIDPKTGDTLFLLAQSYMPAQDIHVLINPSDMKNSPWYSFPKTGNLVTPEWTFAIEELKRF